VIFADERFSIFCFWMFRWDLSTCLHELHLLFTLIRRCETDGDILSLSSQLCTSASEVHSNSGDEIVVLHTLAHAMRKWTDFFCLECRKGFWINVNVPSPSLLLMEQIVTQHALYLLYSTSWRSKVSFYTYVSVLNWTGVDAGGV
jgi:hypothetical protein